MKHKFIKNHWLKIIIILVTCFIVIPVIMSIFKLNEGFIDPLLDSNKDAISTNSIDSQINKNLSDIYSINKDISNNIYRKSDVIKDISHNLYDKDGNNLLNIILTSLYGLSTKIDDMKKEEPIIEKIKCIADFGTNIGDDLCCGQSGVLTNTKYVCPENYSKCDNMKCGSKYGTCVKP